VRCLDVSIESLRAERTKTSIRPHSASHRQPNYVALKWSRGGLLPDVDKRCARVLAHLFVVWVLLCSSAATLSRFCNLTHCLDTLPRLQSRTVRAALAARLLRRTTMCRRFEHTLKTTELGCSLDPTSSRISTVSPQPQPPPLSPAPTTTATTTLSRPPPPQPPPLSPAPHHHSHHHSLPPPTTTATTTGST
jgi:hypothetical protein